MRKLIISPFFFLVFFSMVSFAEYEYSNGPQAIFESACEYDYPPFCIVKPDGSADGFSVELLKTVVNAMSCEVTFKVGAWNEIKQGLKEGVFDVLPLVGYSPERDEVYDFTVPYLTMHGEIFIRKGEKSIKSLDDLHDKEVLVMKGDNAHEWAVKEKLTSKFITTTTYEEAFKMLSRGKHDAVIAQKLMGLQLVKKLGIENLVTAGELYSDETNLKLTRITTSGFQQKFCFAVKEGNKELLSKLNEALTIVIANGTYDMLYNKWFGPILPAPSVPLREQIKNLLIVLIPLIVLLMVFGLIYLRREVNRKTLHLELEIDQREEAEKKKKEIIKELRAALNEIKTLRGIIPLCSFCKKMRDDKGYWEQVDVYIHKYGGAEISHGVCPDCMEEHYPDEYKEMVAEKALKRTEQ